MNAVCVNLLHEAVYRFTAVIINHSKQYPRWLLKLKSDLLEKQLFFHVQHFKTRFKKTKQNKKNLSALGTT